MSNGYDKSFQRLHEIIIIIGKRIYRARKVEIKYWATTEKLKRENGVKNALRLSSYLVLIVFRLCKFNQEY